MRGFHRGAAAIAVLALVTAGATMLTATSAQAMSPCQSDNPPPACDTDPGPAPSKPLTPTSLTAIGVLQTQVQLQWTDAANNETGYIVVRNDPNNNTYATFQLPANSTGYSDSTAQPSHYYTYSVSAEHCVESRCSVSATASVNVQTHQQPANPYGAYNAATTSYFSTWPMSGWAIDWDTTGPLQVNLLTDGVVTQSQTANQAVSGLNTSYPGYSDNHGYSFNPVKPTNKGSHSLCVVAVNVGGGSDLQLGCRSYVIYGPPSAASNVTAVAKSGSVTISFTDNANDETSYTLQRSDGQGNYLAIQSLPAVSGTGRTTSVVDLSNIATGSYCYVLVASNNYGNTASAPGCTS